MQNGQSKTEVAAREQIVHDSPELAQQIREGVEEAEAGRTVYLGSFGEYLDDDEESSG